MIRISGIFIGYIIAYLITVWFVFAACEVDLIDLSSMWKMTLLLLVVAVLLLKVKHGGIELILVLAIYVLMFCTAQFLLYLVAPEMISPRYRNILSAHAISAAMTYILLGACVMGFGFLAGARVRSGDRRHNSTAPVLPYSPSKTVLILIASSLIMFIYTFILGFVNPNWQGTRGFSTLFFGYLTLFFNDAPMLLIMYAVFLQRRSEMSGKLKGLMLVGVAMVALMNLGGGSRGGLIRPMQYFLFSVIALKGNFRISTKMLLALLAVVVVSFTLFPVVTAIKYAFHSGQTVFDAGIFSLLAGGTGGFNPVDFMVAVANRLNGIDPVAGLLTIPKSFFTDVLSFGGNVKYVVNGLIPFFTPFDAAISSAQLYNVLMFDFSIEQIIENYQTQSYTAWGLAYVYFGWFGGLAVLFVEAFVLSALFQLAAKTKSVLNAFYRIWVVVFTYGIFQGFGYDEQLFSHRIFLTTGIGYLFAMHFLDRRTVARVFLARNSIPPYNAREVR